jgi:hypothetical protein
VYERIITEGGHVKEMDGGMFPRMAMFMKV